jgi:8-amino-7-oxononanoate synthase
MAKELENLEQQHLKRKIRVSAEATQAWLTVNGKRQLNLASNNYLGLADDQRLKEAAIQATQAYGAGATASRLIVGNHPLYEQAERALREWKQAEAGLILNSGYTANIGILSALANRDTIIFSDKLNHASIVDGLILSRAEMKRYRHLDMAHLQSLLAKAPAEMRKLIVTDTIFSMDGDMAPLNELVDLKERYGALLMVDEAHASGIYGTKGEGLVHQLGLSDQVDIVMGTFSKALGSFGAYVTGRRIMIDYLVNHMRSFIYTTALPPGALGAIHASIGIVETDQHRRRQLIENGLLFRNGLRSAGFQLAGSESHIIPIVVGPADVTLAFGKQLQEAGVAAIAVRPPTVPQNGSRIRFTVMATHRKEELFEAIAKITSVGKSLGVI